MCSFSSSSFFLPADKLAGDTLPPSCLYLCRVLVAPIALLFLLHFFTCQWWDFLPPSTSASKPHIFFRNFLSTYFALTQASFSCLCGGKQKPLVLRNPSVHTVQVICSWCACANWPHAAGSRFFQSSLFTGALVDAINYRVTKLTH